MIDIMSPLINEADNFTTDILDIILINIVEPKKSQNRFAYQLAEQLIVKTCDSLETIIKLVGLLLKILKDLILSFPNNYSFSIKYWFWIKLIIILKSVIRYTI